MPRRELTPTEFFAITIPMLLVGAIILPVFLPGLSGTGGSRARRASCQSNLKQIGLGIMQYTQDYDERLPLVNISNLSNGTYASVADSYVASTASATPRETEPYGWADAVQPYIKSTALYRCPARNDPRAQTNARRRHYTDYWFNRNLSASSLVRLGLAQRTLMVGDGNDGFDLTNARYNLSRLPRAWRRLPDSPAYRHLDSMNLLFGDGHVKSVPSRAIMASPHYGPSFALR